MDIEKLISALKPFVDRFAEARESYAKRYCADHEIGFKTFDKMPDECPMEKLKFDMGTYRRAAEAYDAATGQE